MKKGLSTLFLALSSLWCSTLFAKGGEWKKDLQAERVFIENKGQFNQISSHLSKETVLFSFDGYTEDIVFSKTGVAFVISELKQRVKSEEEKVWRTEKKKQGFKDHKDFQAFEKLGMKMDLKTEELFCYWEGANANIEVIPLRNSASTHSYSFYNENYQLTDVSGLKGYKELLYKNLYPNIDVLYEFHPESGIKYSVIVHPGGDISKVKLHYSRTPELSNDGKLITHTSLGDIIDHAPITFYKNDRSQAIPSSYSLEGNVLSFSVGNYDRNKTLIIDPWVQTPTFNPSYNWHCIWECETDAAGNSYIIGGVMPLQLKKYNNAGVLQWTYNTPYDTTGWLGTFATDDVGNSYVTNGSSAAIIKVDNAGNIVWNNPNPGGLLALTEFWNIAFNCDQTKLVIAGTDGPAFGGPIPYIFDINTSNGNVISAVEATGAAPLFGIPPNTNEVRAITATENGKYYFLTHDSIGYINQDLSICPGQGGYPFHVENGGYNLSYKCDNWRYNNTGIEALAYYDGFIFVNRGNRLDKRDFATAAIVQSVAIPGGSFTSSLGQNVVGNSGIAIDDCGNIYVGSTNGVYKFNQSLVQQPGTFTTTFNVYDVEITSTGEVIAAGSTGNSGSSSRTGSVQSFAASACAQQSTICCDPTVCAPPPLCTTDSPITLTPGQSGGSWNSVPGFNPATGVFDPAAAGPGTYTLTYTLPCGSSDVEVVVSACTSLSVCVESNGNLSVSGGTGPYNWQSQTTTQDCSACIIGCNFPAGCAVNVTSWTTYATGTTVAPPSSYPIQVVDGFGTIFPIANGASLPACTACPTLTITPSAVTDVTCNGGTNGSFSVTTSGGTGPYDYTLVNGGGSTVASFSNVAGSQSFSGLAPGTYTLNVLDDLACPGSITITINQPSAIAVSQTANTPASCGANNGSATVSATGGTGGLTITWNTTPVQTGATASNLAAGSYTVTVTDANNCTATLNITITSSGGPTVTINSPTMVSCNGGTNGSATATVSGGTAPYSYSWNTSPVQTTQTASNLPAGNFTVTITDNAGCVSTQSVIITEPSAITASTSVVDASCGASDGSATVTASGGTGVLSYSWNSSPVQTTATATNLAAGTYTVTITDANGCTSTAQAIVNNSGGPTASISSTTNITCHGNADGYATVTASGGTTPYTYSWNTSPAQTTATANNLGAGSYTVTVTDGAGCTTSATVTITEPTALSGTTSSTNATCSAADGSATVTVSGGTGPYSYSWSSGGTGSTESNLTAGSYSVDVTDANGCTSSFTVTVGTSSTANIDAGPDVIIPAGGSTTLTASGGVSYIWTPDSILSCSACQTTVASPSQTTAFIVTGTDANGCVGTDTVWVFIDMPCGEIFVPNAFSPNGDSQNDELCIYGNCIQTVLFQIFDRWGEKVFETQDPALCWDGKWRDKVMNTGVFFYYISATLSNGDVYEKSGNISLIR